MNVRHTKRTRVLTDSEKRAWRLGFEAAIASIRMDVDSLRLRQELGCFGQRPPEVWPLEKRK